MLTRSKTKREREASAPVHLDMKDVGHGTSWSKIKIPNGNKRKFNFGWQKYERQGQQLLPGIPNEITLDLITPKLPWITFHTLVSVSSTWRQAIQSRQVYNARYRAHSTEALIIISPLRDVKVKDGEDKEKDWEKWIGLYSMREEKVYRLPRIKNSTGLPRACQCISLDGKVYVMGGLSRGLSSDLIADRSMYVLDLVASKGWKRCASMKSGRSGFGCCIVDGKIFVCGGHAGEYVNYNRIRDAILLEPEVYDPQLNRWSSLKSMTSLRVGNEIAVLGDEILVYSGYVCHLNKSWPLFRTNFPEIYNVILDEWRTVEDHTLTKEMAWVKHLFVTQGKIHSIDYTLWGLTEGEGAVEVYNLDKKSWSNTGKSLFFEVSGKFGTELATPLVVDNEIVRLIGDGMSCVPRLIHSSGFNDEREIRAWQIAKTPFRIACRWFLHPCMSVIRL